jgi:hypothetical protein
MATQARRAPMANQARMGRMAGVALLERQVLKALPVRMEPKERKAGREIINFLSNLIGSILGCDN